MPGTLTQPRIVVAGRFTPHVAIVEVAQDFGTLEQWRQLMTNTIDALPLSPPDFAKPDTVGAMDYWAGDPPNHHRYGYTAQQDIDEYYTGYGECATQPDLADEDYADYMADVEWIRRGC